MQRMFGELCGKLWQIVNFFFFFIYSSILFLVLGNFATLNSAIPHLDRDVPPPMTNAQKKINPKIGKFTSFSYQVMYAYMCVECVYAVYAFFGFLLQRFFLINCPLQ